MSASGPPVIPIPPNIQTITAPLILGELFATYMYGLLTVQFYLYYITFPNDSKYIKLLAYGVFLIESLSCAMCIYDTYGWFASGYGNMIALNQLYFSAFDTPMMEAMVGGALQLLYCYRIYMLNKKALVITIFIGLLVLTEVTAGIYVGIATKVQAETILEAAANDFTAQIVLWVAAAAADITIAVTMITILLRRRKGEHSAAPYQRSEVIISKIIKLIVETNLASTFLAILIVCVHLASPNTNWFVCPALVLGRVYSNSLFLILNNRHYLRSVNQPEASTGSHQLSRFRPMNGDYLSGGDIPKNDVRIELETMTVVHSDSDGKNGGRDSTSHRQPESFFIK